MIFISSPVKILFHWKDPPPPQSIHSGRIFSRTDDIIRPCKTTLSRMVLLRLGIRIVHRSNNDTDTSSVSDSHSLSEDPDPAFLVNSDPDLALATHNERETS
jgi:hypothetical protein